MIGAASAGLLDGAGGLLSSGIDDAAGSLAESAVSDATDETSEAAAETADAGTESSGEDASARDSEESGPSCGGESFTAKTKVLLANGKAVPISSLKPGEKVLATTTKTGKNQAESVTAVLIHDDRDLYDLKVRAVGRTTVIDTTSSHLFWAPDSRRWIKAAALKYGTHLRTPSGGQAVALGGYIPRQSTGWMWDLTVPGNNDHDFYVMTAVASVLVHNCGGLLDNLKDTAGEVWSRVKPMNTTRPVLQLGLGALGGGVNGVADGLQQGKRGWTLVGDTLLGASTGAASNLGIGDSLGLAAGFGAGAANSLGGDLINNGGVTKADWGWATLGGGLGAGENLIGTGMSNASPSRDATVGNGWDVGLAGVQGLVCGGMDSQDQWNC